MGMTHTQIIRDLQLKKFHPVYFLCGEETFFIDQIVKVFQDEILEYLNWSPLRRNYFLLVL
jgi:DNA polymerase III delta subunit